MDSCSAQQAVSASLLRRAAAMVYDALLVIALWLSTLFALVLINGGEAVPRAVTQPIAVVELFVFFAYFWLHKGQTLGMLAWRLRLQSINPPHQRLHLRQALVRFIGAVLSFASLGIGYLWMLVDAERRTLPDILSGTRVLVEPKGRSGSGRAPQTPTPG